MKRKSSLNNKKTELSTGPDWPLWRFLGMLFLVIGSVSLVVFIWKIARILVTFIIWALLVSAWWFITSAFYHVMRFYKYMTTVKVEKRQEQVSIA